VTAIEFMVFCYNCKMVNFTFIVIRISNLKCKQKLIVALCPMVMIYRFSGYYSKLKVNYYLNVDVLFNLLYS